MILAFPARPRKRWPLPCSPTRHGTGSRETFLRLLAQSGRRFWGRYRMCEKSIPAVLRGGRGNPTNGRNLSGACLTCDVPENYRGYTDPSLRSGCFIQLRSGFFIKIRSGCFKKLCLILVSFLCFIFLSCSHSAAPDTIVLIIEFSPSNLDPRIGVDAQSERIDELIFDSLVRKDEHFNLQPAVAERWDTPDPQTYVFHLRHGIHFHDGRPLTARDVKWT